MKIKYIVLALLLVSIAATSCKRKNIRGDLKNRREILQTYDWKLINITANGGPSSVPPCQQDNIYRFEPGGTGRYLEGEYNCLDSTGSGNAPTYTPFRWEVTGDLRYIILRDFGGDPAARFEWDVQNMTFDRLNVAYFDSENGIDIRVAMEFAAVPK